MGASIAYFAGAGTVVTAIAVGLGGGFVIANVMNPNAKRELSKVELQAKAQPSPQPNAAQPSPQPSASPETASNKPQTPQTPAPYLAQVQPAANAPIVVGTASQNQPQPQSQKQDEAAKAPPVAKTKDPSPKRDDAVAAKRDDTSKTKRNDTATAKRDDAPKAKQAEETPSQPATHDEAASSPENAYAKAGDADLKRRDDKRKGRQQQWVARHQQQRDQQMRDVEEQVRRDSGPHEVIVRRDDSDGPDFARPDYDRPDYDRPRRFGFPHINLFGPDD